MRRATAPLAAVLAVLWLLAACSAGPRPSLDEVRSSGVLRVGTEGTYTPFSYHDPATNELTGYDIEVITAVADRLGAKPEFVEAPFDALFASLVSDRFDVVANQVTRNPEREGKYALSPGEDLRVVLRRGRLPRRGRGADRGADRGAACRAAVDRAAGEGLRRADGRGHPQGHPSA